MTVNRTFSDTHLRRLRTQHAKSDDYGRHRHLYLHDTMRGLAATIGAAKGERATLFDYGCGKGRFLEEMRRLDVFGDSAGYDPAAPGFQTLPSGRYDLVTCLDVLDAAEGHFVDAVIEEVARITANTAVFDCLTKPAPKSGFKPHPPFYWIELVAKRMSVLKTEMHFLGLAGHERAVIIAKPAT
jgi:hypothetical protein